MIAGKINWNPPLQTLTEFSSGGMFVLGMVAAPLMVWRGNIGAATVLWAVALLLGLVGFVRPQGLKYPFIALSLITWPIGWVVSHAAMALIYYGVITPVALLFRLIGRDMLQRRFDRGASTYWEAYNPDRGMRRYLRQF